MKLFGNRRTGSRLPEIDLKPPEWKAPDIEVAAPDLKVPDLTVPDLKVPQIRAELPHFDRRRPRTWPSALVTALAGALGAASMYFLDPERGRARRAQTVDRLAAWMRGSGRDIARASRKLSADAYGRVQQARRFPARATGELGDQPNDAALAHKVESELFRDPAIPKGNININAENGVVVLRGSADSQDQMHDIERRARDVAGVSEVRNLMHAPEPAEQQEPISVS